MRYRTKERQEFMHPLSRQVYFYFQKDSAVTKLSFSSGVSVWGDLVVDRSHIEIDRWAFVLGCFTEAGWTKRANHVRQEWVALRIERADLD